MTSFPPKAWEARYLADWPTFSPSQPEVANLHITAMVAVRSVKIFIYIPNTKKLSYRKFRPLSIRPAEGHEGDFKFLVGSQDSIKIRISASSILPVGDMQKYTLSAEVLPDQLGLQTNSCSSKWMDVAALIHSQDVDVTDDEGEFANEAFLASIDKCKR